MPNKATALKMAPALGLIGAVDFPQDALSGGNLVGAHHQQRIADIKHRIMQQHIEQGVFLKEGSGKVFQVFDQTVIRLRPVHGEVVAVFVARRGVGKITAIGAVGNDKQLQIFE